VLACTTQEYNRMNKTDLTVKNNAARNFRVSVIDLGRNSSRKLKWFGVADDDDNCFCIEIEGFQIER
jgi:hypothetical protein